MTPRVGIEAHLYWIDQDSISQGSTIQPSTQDKASYLNLIYSNHHPTLNNDNVMYIM